MGILLIVMLVTYPAIQVLYNCISRTNYEILVLLLLSMVKIATKGIFLRVASQRDDIIPEQVIFTVDFFDALYLATFMPSLATSSVVGIVIIDLVDTAVELRELHHRTQSALSRLHGLTSVSSSSNDLLAAARSLCYSVAMLEQQEIRVRSCTFYHLSNEGRALVQNLDSSGWQLLHHRRNAHLPPVSGPRRNTIAVQPYSPAPDVTKEENEPVKELTMPREPWWRACRFFSHPSASF